MRFHAKLLVHDGEVLCPRFAGWRDIEDCMNCQVLERISEDDRGRRHVECRPVVQRPVQTFSKMVRA